jgi:hypothetical protein
VEPAPTTALAFSPVSRIRPSHHPGWIDAARRGSRQRDPLTQWSDTCLSLLTTRYNSEGLVAVGAFDVEASAGAGPVEPWAQRRQSGPAEFVDRGVAPSDGQQDGFAWSANLRSSSNRPVDVGRDQAQPAAVPEAADDWRCLGELERCPQPVRRDRPWQPEGSADVLLMDTTTLTAPARSRSGSSPDGPH